MNEGIQTFGKTVIINNFQLMTKYQNHFEYKKWMDDIKKIQSMYVVDTKYEKNRTLIYEPQTKEQFLMSMDQFYTKYVILIPRKITNFVDKYLMDLLLYITNEIRMMCSWEVANNMRFELYIYMVKNHEENYKLRESVYMQTGKETRKTILERNLEENYQEYIFLFQWNERWEIIPSMRTDLIGMNIE